MIWVLLTLGALVAVGFAVYQRQGADRRDRVLRVLLYRPTVHARDVAAVLGVDERAAERVLRRMFKAGLVSSREVSSSAHTWGAYVQRYWSPTDVGRDRGRELEDERWRDEE